MTATQNSGDTSPTNGASSPSGDSGNAQHSNTSKSASSARLLSSVTQRKELLFVPCVLVAVVFLALHLGFANQQLSRRTEQHERGDIMMRLARFSLQASDELGQSTTFLKYFNSSLTIRQLQWPMQATQDTTVALLRDVQREFLKKYPEWADRLDVNPYTAFPFSTLRNMQSSVLRRSVSTSDVIAFFTTWRLSALRIASLLAAEELSKGDAVLYAALRSSFMAARSSFDRVAAALSEPSQPLTSLLPVTLAARALADATFFNAEVQALIAANDAPAGGTSLSAMEERDTLERILATFQTTSTFTASLAQPEQSSVLVAMSSSFRRIAGRFLATAGWNDDPRTDEVIQVALASTGIALLVVVLIFVVARMISAALQEAHDALEVSQVQALESSYRRMLRFVDSIVSMRVGMIKSTEGKHVQPVERDVYSLEAPTRLLFSFLHPALPALRENTRVAAAAAAALNTATAKQASRQGEKDPLLGQADDGDLIDMNAALGGDADELKAAGTDDVAVEMGNVGDSAAAQRSPSRGRRHSTASAILRRGSDLVPKHLVSTPVTLLFIDLEGFQNRVTSETTKVLPREFSMFIQKVSSIAEQNGGVVHEFSAAKLILAWNLDGNYHESETSACTTVTALHRTFGAELTHLRFSVVTGDCSVGVVGTDTLKVVTCLGPILPLGNMLLKLNRLHGTVTSIDDTTFAKLDGQTFRTRPMEVIAVDASQKKSVAFEMLMSNAPADKDGRSASWNEAFDEYKSGNFERAKFLLRRWQQNFGDTRSLQRLMQLLNETPPRTCTMKLNEDGLIEDELM